MGINDVWKWTMEPGMARTGSSPSEYEVTYDALLSRMKKQCDCQLVRVEPFMFCRDRSNTVFGAIMPYIEIVRRLAAKYDAVRARLQEAIDQRITEVPPEKWSQDSVHPHLWAPAWILLRRLEATVL